MLKEDHWCPAALIAYGMVPRPTPLRGHPYNSFEEGRYIGVLTAPLNTAAFKPDVVIIYANTSQLRSLMLTLPLEEGLAVKSHFFPPSCAYAVVHVMQDRSPWIGKDGQLYGQPARGAGKRLRVPGAPHAAAARFPPPRFL
jgi:hypothetical protein